MASSTTVSDVGSSDPPHPCWQPEPTYDSTDVIQWYACQHCGYMIECDDRRTTFWKCLLDQPIWRHHVPLMSLRPPTAEALRLLLAKLPDKH